MRGETGSRMIPVKSFGKPIDEMPVLGGDARWEKLAARHGNFSPPKKNSFYLVLFG